MEHITKPSGRSLAIVGSDTDAGKTVLTMGLYAYCRRYFPDTKVALTKPIQAGPGDREQYQDLFQLNQSPETINPIYLRDPLAPPLAADREGVQIDLGVAWRSLTQLQRSYDATLVETAGGLGSPMTWELTVADLMRDWRLPVVLVVPLKLGCIAQTVANVALARQCKLDVKGIVFNCVEPRSLEEQEKWAPASAIAQLTQLPVLGVIPYLEQPWTSDSLSDAIAGLDLEYLDLKTLMAPTAPAIAQPPSPALA
ncbi:MAG: dethiobiotin synthase [Cyanobacteria bacterium P01_H01_bin.130]